MTLEFVGWIDCLVGEGLCLCACVVVLVGGGFAWLAGRSFLFRLVYVFVFWLVIAVSWIVV